VSPVNDTTPYVQYAAQSQGVDPLANILQAVQYWQMIQQRRQHEQQQTLTYDLANGKKKESQSLYAVLNCLKLFPSSILHCFLCVGSVRLHSGAGAGAVNTSP